MYIVTGLCHNNNSEIDTFSELVVQQKRSLRHHPNDFNSVVSLSLRSHDHLLMGDHVTLAALFFIHIAILIEENAVNWAFGQYYHQII